MSNEPSNLIPGGSDRGQPAAQRSRFNMAQGFSVLLIGAGIGWLAGLSTSPVVVTIIASMLSLGVGVVTVLQSLQLTKDNDPRHNTDPYLNAKPAAIFILGIALATPLGIMVRTYHILEPHRSEIVYSLPDSSKTASTTATQNVNREKQDQGVLFAQYEDECDQLLSLAAMKNYTAFVQELKKSNIPGAQEMVSKFQDDPETLEFFLKTIRRNYISKP